MREQRQRLEHHAEIAPVHRLVVDPLAVEADLAGGRGLEAGDDPHQRGLAAARRPQQADEAAGRHRQDGVVDGEDLAVALGDVDEVEGAHDSVCPVIEAAPCEAAAVGVEERQPTISSVHFWFSQSGFST